VLFADRVEVITGYGDHAKKVTDLFAGILPIMLAKVFAIATHVQRSFDPAFGLRPIIEIRVIGHSDRVWKKGAFGSRDLADEDKTSQDRADDVWRLLHTNFVTLSFPIDIFIRDGVTDVTVTGAGAREPLVVSKNVAPENRRVEIAIFSTKGIPI
jgi:flagellar motor protein MotB